ncbi:Leucine-rich repeat-containing protein 59 [Hondaea fermentalgiana]|uniref:Leucine-rich repeat-containing protein 59 n=1 Tax=Hondaea fermentalgiana TaxID=2315210 RepID=A0A2R5GS08_9STRA|nr:Leucine-rich repeat-containing protein 59 [Hondaea fermentalgiana]|eukprot:GBG33089.1 Leucine-rich repeat-containing protein 59 [Hondaea fermentalgiana]
MPEASTGSHDFKVLTERARESKTSESLVVSNKGQLALEAKSQDLIDSPRGGRRTRQPAKHATASQLDGFLLLEASGAEYPDEATSAKLVDKGLNEVVSEDLRYYSRLSFADFGENQLKIQDLTNLHALEELRLPDNKISSIEWVSPRPFSSLTILDLSFNALTSAAVGQLAALERLRELDLTSNRLGSLPDNMCAFVHLELLMLNNNRIADSDSLGYLSEAPRLRELDLSNNKVSSFPENLDFPALEWLSLVGNDISTHDDLAPLAELPELVQVLLYNNPITAVTRRTSVTSGETRGTRRDPMQEHTADALPAESRFEGRDVINVVTDAPSFDSVGTGHSASKIRGLYRGFKVTKIAEVRMLNPREWKERGRKLLEDNSQMLIDTLPNDQGAQSLHESNSNNSYKSKSNSGSQEEVSFPPTHENDADRKYDDTANQHHAGQGREDTDDAHSFQEDQGPESVFLTEPSLFEGAGYVQPEASQNRQLRSLGGGRNVGRQEEKDQETALRQESGVPDASLFTTGTSTLELRAQLDLFHTSDNPSLRRAPKHNPALVGTATTALRFALQHPLTAHTADTMDDPSEEALLRLTRQTSSSKQKVKDPVAAARCGRKPEQPRSTRPAPKTGIRARPTRKDKQLMDNIETVLNRMDFGDAVSDQFQALEYGGRGAAGDARAEDESDRAAQGLMSMVSQVMRDFS